MEDSQGDSAPERKDYAARKKDRKCTGNVQKSFPSTSGECFEGLLGKSVEVNNHKRGHLRANPMEQDLFENVDRMVLRLKSVV